MALRANDPRLGLTVKEWEELEDPPGYRFEVIQGELDMTPGATPEHGRALGELYVELRRNLPEGLRIVIDVDWLLSTAARVTAAPRPDLMVIPMDGPVVPLLVAEVLSPSRRSVSITPMRGWSTTWKSTWRRSRSLATSWTCWANCASQTVSNGTMR
jgi:Uma2 family endonuclease